MFRHVCPSSAPRSNVSGPPKPWQFRVLHHWLWLHVSNQLHFKNSSKIQPCTRSIQIMTSTVWLQWSTFFQDIPLSNDTDLCLTLNNEHSLRDLPRDSHLWKENQAGSPNITFHRYQRWKTSMKPADSTSQAVEMQRHRQDQDLRWTQKRKWKEAKCIGLDRFFEKRNVDPKPVGWEKRSEEISWSPQNGGVTGKEIVSVSSNSLLPRSLE